MRCWRAILLVVLCAMLAPTAQGQTYEGLSHLLVSGGVSLQFGGLGDFWDPGPQGRLTIRLPVANMLALGIQAGAAGPQSSDKNSELIQIPLRVIAHIPLAPEASGTPYIAVGAGGTVNLFSCIDADLSCFSDETKTYFTYDVGLGYTLRPEAMGRAFFDFSVRYEQQIIDNASDFKSLDFEVGMGLCF